MKSGDTIQGIKRIDLQNRGPWRRKMWWWLGGPIVLSKTFLAVWRKVGAPIEAPFSKPPEGG